MTEATMTASPTIARIWRGSTRRELADSYEQYLRREGIPPLERTALRVQLIREDRETQSDFMTISYWPDIAGMTAFTGGDPCKVHHLPRDEEFLIELPKRVQVMRIVIDRGFAG
jgi:hypothetical protein